MPKNRIAFFLRRYLENHFNPNYNIWYQYMPCPPLFVKCIIQHFVDLQFPVSNIGRPRNTQQLSVLTIFILYYVLWLQWCNLPCKGSYKTIQEKKHCAVSLSKNREFIQFQLGDKKKTLRREFE